MNKYELLKESTLFVGDFKECLEDLKNVDVILTSPPYNIGSKSPKKLGNRKNGVYDTKTWGSIEGYQDNMEEEEYQKSQRNFLIFCSKKIKDDGVVIYNHKPRHKNGRLIHPYIWFPKELTLHEEIIWDRGSTHNHCSSFCYQESERIYVFKKTADAKIYFNVDNDGSDSRSDIWYLPPTQKDSFSKKHNAPFPLQLAQRCLFRWAKPNALVCDPYSGSGTTMIAAHFSKCRFVGSEKLEKYAKLSVERMKEYVGNQKV